MPVVDEFGREIQGFGGGGARVDRSPSPSPPRDRGGRDDINRHYQRRPRSHSTSSRRHHHHRHHHHKRSPSPPPPHRHRRRREHASVAYEKDPMLCEYVWKDQQAKKREANGGGATSTGEEDEPATAEAEPTLETQDNEEGEETYDDYRHAYCLNYVRSFFNEHMDDSWFRKTYSPLERKREVEKERERAADEAAAFSQQVSGSPVEFIEQARLGNGTKESTVGPRKRKYSDDQPSSTPTVNAVPQSHVLSTNDCTIVVNDIPPQVTDDQLLEALVDHLSTPSTIKIFSSAVSTTTKQPLVRRAYAIVSSPQVRNDLLGNLKNAQPHHHHKSAEGHVPRKEDDYMPKELDLDVDCSDPFGRVEVDEDGKGGGDDSQAIPHRKCIAVVSSMPPKQNVSVLSAAVSSVERIPRDKDAAVMMARALDVSHSIPPQHRLDQILEGLGQETSTSDLLDVAIAYLRRVHLFSFYNGCSVADKSLGQVLSGQHAAGTIHLRLAGADDLLKESVAGEAGVSEQPASTDMLVMRLDDSISKALEESATWVDNTFVLDQAQDEAAAEIEEMEKQTHQEWLDNHGTIDGDGRARCSFHFCRKLFKDDSFLKKHLLKKHGEYLKAEQAKCHDSYMMKAWDEEANRPVPPVLVDCGANFGRVPSAVVGAQPMAEDPEPELWRKEEEKRRRIEEEKERRQERRDEYGQPPPAGPEDEQQPLHANRPSNFVDVDDMQEEKVELSFENVEVVAPPPKKKKKKKKLL